ncbi:MAG: septum formation initiator family protein [Myxococcales bacterium]|nr:septum formation initiator family protein [Myxococcales bacterium]
MSALRERMALALPLGVLALAVISVPAMVFGPDGLSRHRRLSAQLVAQRQENQRLARELIQLRRELDAMANDPRAVERAVREAIGWVRPDELIVEVPSLPRGGR